MSKTAGREKGRACKHLFKYLNQAHCPPPPPSPTSCKTVSQNVNCQNVKRCGVGGFHMLNMFVRLDTQSQKIDVSVEISNCHN